MLRRQFLRRSGGVALLSLAPAALATARDTVSSLSAAAPDRSAGEWARDEAFWSRVAADFSVVPDFISLEYGYFCPAALPTLNAEIDGTRQANTRASVYKRTDRVEDLEASRKALADLANVSPEEIAITRNATESLNILFHGIDLQPGEEIVYGDQDYGSMVEALKQKATRFGIGLKKVSIPFHPADDAEIVDIFAQAIGPKTRLLHVTHMINLTGHVLPVRKICDMAHERGVEVIVDSAHAFAHTYTDIEALGCDYLAVSLHKWLCAPVGLGLLYVRKDKIEKVWPLIGDTGYARDDIRKLEQVGTRPDDHVNALRPAIDFHRTLGDERKFARLKYLKSYWAEAVRELPGVTLNTPWQPERHGAIANIAIAGWEPNALADYWMREHAVFTAGIEHPVVRGVRVTPGVPTLRRHLDHFIGAVEAASAKV